MNFKYQWSSRKTCQRVIHLSVRVIRKVLNRFVSAQDVSLSHCLIGLRAQGSIRGNTGDGGSWINKIGLLWSVIMNCSLRIGLPCLLFYWTWFIYFRMWFLSEARVVRQVTERDSETDPDTCGRSISTPAALYLAAVILLSWKVTASFIGMV